MFSSVNKTFGYCSKIFGCSNKNFVVPNFVVAAKPFFPCEEQVYFARDLTLASVRLV